MFELFRRVAAGESAPSQTAPVIICESEIDRFTSVYPQLSRAEIIMTMVRFGPSRPLVEDAMRFKAGSKIRESQTS
jgi:hypothetical protein